MRALGQCRLLLLLIFISNGICPYFQTVFVFNFKPYLSKLEEDIGAHMNLSEGPRAVSAAFTDEAGSTSGRLQLHRSTRGSGVKSAHQTLLKTTKSNNNKKDADSSGC